MEKNMALGAGKLYITSWDGSTIPEDAIIENDENCMGLIEKGASITYNPEYKTFTDAMGIISETFLVKEECRLKTEFITWNFDTLKKLIPTGILTVDETTKRKTLKVGGLGNYSNSSYLIRFVHEDNRKGNLRATIVGTNQAGFELNYFQEDVAVLDAEFIAKPSDNNGTLVILDEDDPTV